VKAISFSQVGVSWWRVKWQVTPASKYTTICLWLFDKFWVCRVRFQLSNLVNLAIHLPFLTTQTLCLELPNWSRLGQPHAP
jgi:hypothetical protein